MALNLGIDFGSLGLRVAYQDRDRVVDIPIETAAEKHVQWRRCEDSSSSGLGIAFTSIKNKLGMANGAEEHAGGSLAGTVTELFRRAKSAAEAKTKMAVATATIAVPARYSAARRASLRSTALAAGFKEAVLLSDTIAAVLAQMHGKDQPATILVCSMGYAGFELGLVRSARGHTRALGYEGGDSQGGAAIDARMLRMWLKALADANLKVDTRSWTSDVWLRLQMAAQQVKEKLSAEAKAVFPVPITTPDKRVVRAQFTRVVLAPILESMINPVLESAEKLLEESGLAATDVNEILLVGGTAQNRLIAGRIEKRLGRRPVSMDMYALARGAAISAGRSESLPEAITADRDRPSDETEDVSDSSAEPVNLVSMEASFPGEEEGPEAAPPLVIQANAAPPSPAHAIEPAQRLIEGKNPAAARSYLEELIQQAQALLQTIKAPEMAAMPVAPAARKAISTAYALLKQGKLAEAVGQAHLAWQLASEDGSIFDQMIDVHKLAAQARTDFDSHGDAQRWLLCAYQHDRSNSAIRRAIADRFYAQAKQLVERGSYSDARGALKQCFEFSPEHEEALQLQTSMGRK